MTDITNIIFNPSISNGIEETKSINSSINNKEQSTDTKAVLAYVIPLLISMLSLFGSVTAFNLGIDYQEIYYGLHPYLAVPIGIILAVFAVVSFRPMVEIIKGFGEEDERVGE